MKLNLTNYALDLLGESNSDVVLISVFTFDNWQLRGVKMDKASLSGVRFV